ncbi:MAG: hypothetical protein CMK99_21250 [Pseudomonas sp.]|nr:hypothetical protein [Pseudomonas sp.]HBS80576.1 hypothetical protein [Pseudomonas sp.]|tara:strand:+ start:8544 stop:9128 length:585 start_codon:yes stop_codon:yes gene_type:complete
MAYIDPKEVVSPKQSWRLVEVIHNTGDDGWSAAEGKWNGKKVLGLRWNGSESDDGVGSPQSRGYPTWFIVPTELEAGVQRALDAVDKSAVAEVRIYRPEGYDYGAWKIEAKLTESGKEVSRPVVFSIPNLQNRICHTSPEFVKAVGAELMGVFKEGEWHSHIYSNGVPEDENPTKITVVEQAFQQSITRALQFA